MPTWAATPSSRSCKAPVATAGGFGYAYWFANDQIQHHTKTAAIPPHVLQTVKSTEPANYRAEQSLDSWLKSHNIVGLSGVDTRKLTRLIRDKGAPNHRVVDVPDVGHDGDAILTSPCGLAALFDLPGCDAER